MISRCTSMTVLAPAEESLLLLSPETPLALTSACMAWLMEEYAWVPTVHPVRSESLLSPLSSRQ